jgi:hypothetical protein
MKLQIELNAAEEILLAYLRAHVREKNLSLVIDEFCSEFAFEPTPTKTMTAFSPALMKRTSHATRDAQILERGWLNVWLYTLLRIGGIAMPDGNFDPLNLSDWPGQYDVKMVRELGTSTAA